MQGSGTNSSLMLDCKSHLCFDICIALLQMPIQLCQQCSERLDLPGQYATESPGMPDARRVRLRQMLPDSVFIWSLKGGAIIIIRNLVATCINVLGDCSCGWPASRTGRRWQGHGIVISVCWLRSAACLRTSNTCECR